MDDMAITHLQLLIAVLTSFIASSGFWMYIEQRVRKNDLTKRLLIGLSHDRIVYLAEKYLDRGWITHDEYENLCVFLYQPYIDFGGNGAVKRLMSEVDKLPIVQRTKYEPILKGKEENVK